MLSEKDVQHIASLARIHLTENELQSFQKELAAILEYFETLNELDVSKIDPMIHAVELQNVTREDTADCDENLAAELLKQAPTSKDGYFQVKSIF